MFFVRSAMLATLVSVALLLSAHAAESRNGSAEPHNVVLFIPEGLNASAVRYDIAPALERVRAQGVNFYSSYAGFPGFEAQDAPFNETAMLAAAAAARHKDGTPRYSVAVLGGGIAGEGASLSSLDTALDEALSRFAEAKRPFLLVYWFRRSLADSVADDEGPPPESIIISSSERDPNAHAWLLSADQAIAGIQRKLESLHLYERTNIIVAADSGRAGIIKSSRTSLAARAAYLDVMPGDLPPGFLAIDIAATLQAQNPAITLFDPDDADRPVDVRAGEHPLNGNALIGTDATTPYVIVAARGGHDFIYLPANASRDESRRLVNRIAQMLFSQDYVSGLFVDERRLGHIPGALPTRALGWERSATIQPALVVNFRSLAVECGPLEPCEKAIADAPPEHGAQTRGTLSRAATWTFMAARGPDFLRGVRTTTPASNADMGRTIAALLALDVKPLPGFPARVLRESLVQGGGREPREREHVLKSRRGERNLRTVLRTWTVGGSTYLELAGFPGRTAGLPEELPVYEQVFRWPFKITIQSSNPAIEAERAVP